MNIQAEKINLMKLILETNNPSILESIKKLFDRTPKEDLWSSLTSVQKEEIENGISEIENGETVEYESIMSRHRK